MVYFYVDFTEGLSHPCQSKVVTSGTTRPLTCLTHLLLRKALGPGGGFCDQRRDSWKSCSPDQISKNPRPCAQPGSALPPYSGAGHLSPHLWTLGGAGVVRFILLPVRGVEQQTRTQPSFHCPPGALDGKNEHLAPRHSFDPWGLIRV